MKADLLQKGDEDHEEILQAESIAEEAWLDPSTGHRNQRDAESGDWLPRHTSCSSDEGGRWRLAGCRTRLGPGRQ